MNDKNLHVKPFQLQDGQPLASSKSLWELSSYHLEAGQQELLASNPQQDLILGLVKGSGLLLKKDGQELERLTRAYDYSLFPGEWPIEVTSLTDPSAANRFFIIKSQRAGCNTEWEMIKNHGLHKKNYFTSEETILLCMHGPLEINIGPKTYNLEVMSGLLVTLNTHQSDQFWKSDKADHETALVQLSIYHYTGN